MKKYIQVLKATLQEYFIYRLNFVMWRVRSVIQLLLLYFLWLVIFQKNQVVFGYDKSQILTYVLGVWALRALVLHTETAEVGGEISRGDLSLYLLRPISYAKYWFSRDLADKIFNIGFFIVEAVILVFLLKPPLVFQTNLLLIFCTLFSIFIGIFLLFNISFLLGLSAFWTPEGEWGGPRFLFNIILDFFSGGLFPLDILPLLLFRFLQILPFPYLLFFPLNIYLGRLNTLQIFQGYLIMIFWLIVSTWLIKIVWQKGLRVYSAVGR